MANILKFPGDYCAEPVSETPRPFFREKSGVDGEGAEIIIFPGVRIERQSDDRREGQEDGARECQGELACDHHSDRSKH